MTFYRELFPTLDWSRVHFFLGIPWPYNSGDQPMMTLPGGHSQIDIYIAPESYQPCDTEFVVGIGHELVHALQIQESPFNGKGIGRFNMFTINYGTCWSRFWQVKNDRSEDTIPFEVEAFDYDNTLRNALRLAGTGLPCACGLLGVPANNPAFIGATGLQKYGNVIKREAKQHTPCRGQAGRIGAFFWWDGSADNPVLNLLGWTLMGAVIGFLMGGPMGALGGALGGAILGVIDDLTGIPSFLVSIAASLVLALVNVVVAIATWVAEVFGGPGDRPLKMRFSLDEGVTFGEAAILGATSEPPAMVFNNKTLFVSWKSPDEHLNVLVAPAAAGGVATLSTFGDADGNSGPALAWGNGLLYLLWQREDNKLYVRTSTDGITFTGRVQFGGKVPDDATPGIAYGNGYAFAAWIRKRNKHVGMKASVNSGASWGNETTFYFGSHGEGSAAVAYAGNLLFVARATSDLRKVKVATLGITASGTVWVAQDLELGVRCCDDTGPAVAAGNGRVFVSWIGRAEQHPRVRVFSINPGGSLTQVSETVLATERSKDNAGPALAYAESIGGQSILALSWVRKNN